MEIQRQQPLPQRLRPRDGVVRQQPKGLYAFGAAVVAVVDAAVARRWSVGKRQLQLPQRRRD